MAQKDTQWMVWEVFVQAKPGQPHTHVGNVHASDKELAVQNARDLYTRRGEAYGIWVVPAVHITSTQTDENGMFFDPANDKVYRHPQFYKIPKGANLDVE